LAAAAPDYAGAVETLLALGAALVSLRLSADLFARWRRRRRPELAAWSASLAAYAVGAAALAWGAAAGWDDRAFRVYYLAGGMLTAALLGTGSLLFVGRRVGPVALVYTGLAVGIAIAVPLTQAVTGTSIPEAQEHLDLMPARVVAIVGNIAGTVAAVGVALLTVRRRPLANALLLAGVAAAALGSALAGLGTAPSASFALVAALLLYGGFVVSR
jgi:hypothetical protein